MQLLMVLLILPSLLLLSRTRWFVPFRLVGGSLAICAAIPWISSVYRIDQMDSQRSSKR